MRLLAVPSPPRCWNAFQHRHHQTSRIAARFDYLETRQLLSIGQIGPAAGFDAALDLIDVREVTRLHDIGALVPDETLARRDPSRSLSVVFAAAVVSTGGFQLAMQNAGRSPSQGHSRLRWLGTEAETFEPPGMTHNVTRMSRKSPY